MNRKAINLPQKQLFDDKAASYDRWYRTKAGFIVDRIEKEAVFSFLQPEVGLTVLDIGCGTGNYALELARKGLKVTGIDISTGMLAKARARAARENLEINFCLADAQDLPFADNNFDIVLSVSSLEFFLDLQRALNEAYRVLKPGGRLVVGVIGRDSAWGRYYIEKARRDPKSVFNQARFYSTCELKNAMPGKNVQTRSVLFVPPEFNFELEEAVWELEAGAVKAGLEDGGFIVAASDK